MAKTISPITPDEAAGKATRTIPPEVIEEFNAIIVEKYRSGEATVMQKDLIKRIAEKMHVTASDVCEKGWLDVEDAFRDAGWKVEYKAPGCNETFDASFKFIRKHC